MWSVLCVFALFDFVVLGAAAPFECYSDVKLGPVASTDRKGLALDDATLRGCPSKIPGIWPNAEAEVKSLRLFKAWDPMWPDDDRVPTWEHLRDFTHSQNAKIFVGTQITCDKEADDQDWAHVKELIKMLGKEHVMGVAVGNELDILHSKVQADPDGVNAKCIDTLWKDERLWKEFQNRVADLDKMGLESIPVTSVFTAAVIGGPTPFIDNPNAMINTFLTKAAKAYGTRFVFVFNFYPYFDPNFPLDAGTTDQCNQSLKTATCFGGGCTVPNIISIVRQKIQQLSGSGHLLWVGETGWSSPASDTLTTSMKSCPAWSSTSALQATYDGFLDWDLSAPGGAIPDHAFYFTVRDSNNFGLGEHFGLMSKCWTTFCKLTSPGYTGPPPEEVKAKKERERLRWLPEMWLIIGGGAVALSLFGGCFVWCRSCRGGGDDQHLGAEASSA